jgi:urease accessory protein
MTPGTQRLWQLVSPALPVGAYSYSQGLEYAHYAGSVHDADSALAWIGDVLELSVARLDLPLLLRAHAAASAGDAATLRRLSRELEARRETAELRLEDLAMGQALTQLFAGLGEPLPERRLTFACAFAAAAARWSIAAEDACAGYAWAWCEAQVAAAVKLVPLGHTAGQRLLLALGERIPACVATAAALDDGEIGASLPGLAIASALHETQYTRLFRS